MVKFKISKITQEERERRKRLNEEERRNNLCFANCFGIKRQKNFWGRWETDEEYAKRMSEQIVELKKILRSYEEKAAKEAEEKETNR